MVVRLLSIFRYCTAEQTFADNAAVSEKRVPTSSAVAAVDRLGPRETGAVRRFISILSIRIEGAESSSGFMAFGLR